MTELAGLAVASGQGLPSARQPRLAGLSCTSSETHGRVTVSMAPGARSTSRGVPRVPPVMVACTA
ncbi:MAG: hypothetical protein IPF99_38920 [Deltaproteobacteria bacterium]|nr:hypothetical protein [Deltaproteobacteria bacterium]